MRALMRRAVLAQALVLAAAFERGGALAARDAIGRIGEGLLLSADAAAWSGEAAEGTEGERVLSALQWNIHGECFVKCGGQTGGLVGHCDPGYPACRDGAEGLLTSLLEGGADLDFAGVEQLSDPDFFNSSIFREDWGYFRHLCGGSRGALTYPVDSATIFYNRRRWQMLDVEGLSVDAHGGCMESVEGASQNNYRAFVVQAFKSLADGVEVIVAASHYPHNRKYSREIGLLRDTVSTIREKTGIAGLMLIADTNFARSKSSQEIFADIDPAEGSAVSSELFRTCCAFFWGAPYDRIIVGGFNGTVVPLETSLPFTPDDGRPPWVVLNMHDPIIGKFAYSAGKNFTGFDFSEARVSAAPSLVEVCFAALAALAAWLRLD